MPLSAALSCRDPLVSHTPILTERTCVIGSVRMRRPLSSASRTIGEFDKVVGSLQIEVDAGAAHRSMSCKSLTRKELQANLEYNMPPAVRASTGWCGPALLDTGGKIDRSSEVVQNMEDTVTPPINLAELDLAELEAAFASRGLERFRARQVFAWIYRRGVTDVEAMTDLPRDLRVSLSAAFTIETPAIASHERSSDGTEKFLLRLSDGKHIEAVFIPDTPAMTFCIS